MPPRWLCVIIVAAWLGLNGWLFYDELLPRLLPGQPPPFAIDLVEEAQTRRAATAWTVLRNDREAFITKSRVEHPRRDVYELIAESRPSRGDAVSTNGMRIRSMTSLYRVNSAGDLLALEVRFTASPEFADKLLQTDFAGPIAGAFSGSIFGELDGTRLSLTRELPTPDGQPRRRLQLTELDVGRGGSVLMPLHPVKRMRGINPGQAWRTVLLDPFGYFLLPGEPPEVRAKVRPVVELFSWGRRSDVPCVVIDYEGDQVKVSTWVRQEDGAVMCQEATLGRTRWVMYRN